MPTSRDDARLVQTMVEEMKQLADTPMDIALHPVSVMQLVGALQLAMRHPSFDGAARETAENFIEAARTYFYASPATLEALRRGDDPAEDR